MRHEGESSGPKTKATGVTVVNSHNSKGKEKDVTKQQEMSSLPLRHTYNQDLSKVGGKLTEMAKRASTRHFKDKTVRNIRLRPRQILCTKCKASCHDQGQNNNSSAQSTTSRETETNVTEHSSTHSVKSKGRPIKQKPQRIELRKRPLIPVMDTFPRVKLQRLDSSKLKQAIICRETSDTDEGSESTADHDNAATTLVEANIATLPAPPKVSPIIKISIGERTVLKIPPRLHEIKESEGECEEEDAVLVENDNDHVVESEVNKPEVDNEVHLEMPVLEIQSQGTFLEETKAVEKEPFETAQKAEHKKRKKAMKKARNREKYGEHSENTHPERHHKHKKKHKHRHSHDIVERRPTPMVARSPLSSTSYSAEQQFKCTSEENINVSPPKIDSDNEIEKETTCERERPRLLYRWRPKDGFSSLEPKLMGVKELHGSNGNYFVEDSNQGSMDSDHKRDSESERPALSNYSSLQNSPALSNCSSQPSSNEKEAMDCMSDLNLESDYGEGEGDDFTENIRESARFKEEAEMNSVENLKPSLMMRIQTRSVLKCVTSEGRLISVGDIIWGKIQGFPWWPGRVLSISVSQKDNSVVITQLAHVSWFGSSTTSHMQCSDLFPFLEDFKIRYNKKKRGPYKMAIKQATMASQSGMNIGQDIDLDEFDLG